MPGRCGSVNGRASHVGQRNSSNTNRIASRLAPACRSAVPTLRAVDAPGCGVVRRAPASPVPTALVLSPFRRPQVRRHPVLSARKSPPVQVAVPSPGGCWPPEKVLSQHSVLVTRIIDGCFGLEYRGQRFL